MNNSTDVPQKSKSPTFFLTILGIIFLIGYFAYYLYVNYYLPSTITLPPPLVNVEFPSAQAQYPTDWPNELKFPEDFVLVDSSSGTLPENTTKGWSAKFRYRGEPTGAEKITVAFFENNGWTIVENSGLDSGGFALLIQREQGSGVVVIDTDPANPSQTLVIVTLFP